MFQDAGFAYEEHYCYIAGPRKADKLQSNPVRFLL
jgi:hypothetical protein